MGCSASRPDMLIGRAAEEFSCTFSLHSSMPAAPTHHVPKTRSLSAPLVHHPPLRKGDTHHLVSLTSTTYGSLVVVDRHSTAEEDSPGTPLKGQEGTIRRSLSQPNATDVDPSSPDSVINTWELMEGLDDEDCDMDSGNTAAKLNSLNSYCFIGAPKKPSSNLYPNCGKKLTESFVFIEKPQVIVEENSGSNTKPLWKLLSEESLLSKMDPNVASSYQRALSSRQLGYSRSQVQVKSLGSSPLVSSVSDKFYPSPAISEKMYSDSAFSDKLYSDSAISAKLYSSPAVFDDSLCSKSGPAISSLSSTATDVSGSEDKVVLYFTSLRGIRRTYEDCCAVRMILKGFRVLVDERDISMDSTYRKELQTALGGKAMSLPQLFIRGRHIGGVDEIKQLHEDGELSKLLRGFPTMDFRCACESCGDARFLPCPNCNGSRKVFLEEEGLMRRCPDCNENGLIRCPACCS